MEQLKWPTASSWVDETLELFKNIDQTFDLMKISKMVKEGQLFGELKINSAKRVFEAIKARYLKKNNETVVALAKVVNSNISLQEKYNYLLIFFLEYENLIKLFMESYVYNNFNTFGQKIFTHMDLDKFFEIVLKEYHEFLPVKLQVEISPQSMQKVRNQLWRNIENFGWLVKEDKKMVFNRPNLTPEWFVFTLYLYFDGECISAKEVYSSSIYKRFLLNEFDIEYLLTGAKLKGLVDINKLGDVNTITKHEKGLLEYAKTYK